MSDPMTNQPLLLSTDPKMICEPSPTQQTTKVIVCPSCGGVDHQRKSSKKCPNYVARTKKKCRTEEKTDADTAVDNNVSESVTEKKVPDKPKPDQPEPVTQIVTTVPEQVPIVATATTTNTTNTTEVEDVNFSKPKFILLEKNKEYTPVVDVSDPNFKSRETIFKLSDSKVEDDNVDPSSVVPLLMEKFFSLALIRHLTTCSNKYRLHQKNLYPDMNYWKLNTSKVFKLSEMYHFLALLYYFGIVRLPSKRDYWSTDDYMPSHKIAKDLDMSRDRFTFMWRFFHVGDLGDDDNEASQANDVDNEELIETGLDRVQVEKELTEETSNTEDEVEDEEQSNEEEATNKDVWYNKLTFIINHVREVSYSLVSVIGTFLSLDEMMIRFFGRSTETHRMKNKPIKEGYKFFVLTTRIGYILNFTPDGRLAATKNLQEYELDRSLGKIETMVLFVVSVIDRKKKEQLEYVKTIGVKTRVSCDHFFDQEQIMDKFCLAMDNYFTLPKVLLKLRELGIGVVGTARFRSKSWPPKVLREIDAAKAKFNEFYYTIDDFGTMVARWVDNGMVFCVSTIHRSGKMVLRKRKRPRVTANNKGHVSVIWGDKGSQEIFIPTLIDDYNHWMGGVDLSDQRISYYHPTNIRCRRTWIPIFLQLLSIIRNNSYLVYRQFLKKDACSHKEYTLKMIKWFMKKAHEKALEEKKLVAENNPSKSYGKSSNRTRVITIPERRKEPSPSEVLTYNFPSRFTKPKNLHSSTTTDASIGRGTCVVCAANWLKLKADYPDENLILHREVNRTVKHCSYCSYYSRGDKVSFLCKHHFEEFHEKK